MTNADVDRKLRAHTIQHLLVCAGKSTDTADLKYWATLLAHATASFKQRYPGKAIFQITEKAAEHRCTTECERWHMIQHRLIKEFQLSSLA